MSVSLAELIGARQNEQFELHQHSVNPKLARALQIIGFDAVLTEATNLRGSVLSLSAELVKHALAP